MAQEDKKVRRAQAIVIPDRDIHFVQYPFGAIDSQDYREKNKCPTMLLTYLIRNVVRAQMRDDLDLFNNYYKNNHLACSITQERMAKAFNVSRMTISRWIKSLVDDEVLQIDKVHIDGYKKRNVYIVGTHNNIDFCFFMEEVYTNK